MTVQHSTPDAQLLSNSIWNVSCSRIFARSEKSEKSLWHVCVLYYYLLLLLPHYFRWYSTDIFMITHFNSITQFTHYFRLLQVVKWCRLTKIQQSTHYFCTHALISHCSQSVVFGNTVTSLANVQSLLAPNLTITMFT